MPRNRQATVFPPFSKRSLEEADLLPWNGDDEDHVEDDDYYDHNDHDDHDEDGDNDDVYWWQDKSIMMDAPRHVT